MSALLDVKDLKKNYKRADRVFPANNGVNLSLKDGEFGVITGRSGSGKSTLLNILAGLTRPDSGEIHFKGIDLLALTDVQYSLLRSARLGYIPQGICLMQNLTVLDNIRLPLFLSGNNTGSADKALSLLSRVGLKDFAASYPSQLSGGEAKRVAIARALAGSPELILADEPTSDLDSKTTVEVMELFAEINREGAAILMVTHEKEPERYASRRFVMDAGELSESATAVV